MQFLPFFFNAYRSQSFSENLLKMKINEKPEKGGKIKFVIAKQIT